MIELYIKFRDWFLWKFFNRVVVTQEQIDYINQFAEESNFTFDEAIETILELLLESYLKKEADNYWRGTSGSEYTVCDYELKKQESHETDI